MKKKVLDILLEKQVKLNTQLANITKRLSNLTDTKSDLENRLNHIQKEIDRIRNNPEQNRTVEIKDKSKDNTAQQISRISLFLRKVSKLSLRANFTSI